MSDFVLELTDGFQKRLTFNITNGSAHLDDGDSGSCIRKIAVKPAFDLIGDVRDNLNGSSAVVAAAFLLKYGPVDLSGGNIGILVQTFIDETLIMSQVQVCLGSVIGNEHLAVLYRIHGSGIDIDVRVKFLHGHFVTAGFEQSSERCGSNSLAESGYNAACDENVFYWHNPSSCIIFFN